MEPPPASMMDLRLLFMVAPRPRPTPSNRACKLQLAKLTWTVDLGRLRRAATHLYLGLGVGQVSVVDHSEGPALVKHVLQIVAAFVLHSRELIFIPCLGPFESFLAVRLGLIGLRHSAGSTRLGFLARHRLFSLLMS